MIILNFKNHYENRFWKLESFIAIWRNHRNFINSPKCKCVTVARARECTVYPMHERNGIERPSLKSEIDWLLDHWPNIEWTLLTKGLSYSQSVWVARDVIIFLNPNLEAKEGVNLYLLTTFCSITCLKQAHFKFQSYGGVWHKAMNVHIEKYILISFYCVTVQPQNKKLRVSPLVFPLSHYQW